MSSVLRDSIHNVKYVLRLKRWGIFHREKECNFIPFIRIEIVGIFAHTQKSLLFVDIFLFLPNSIFTTDKQIRVKTLQDKKRNSTLYTVIWIFIASFFCISTFQFYNYNMNFVWVLYGNWRNFHTGLPASRISENLGEKLHLVSCK